MRVERFELSATAWKAVNLTINRYPLLKDKLKNLSFKNYLSTSPKTMSCVPITVTTSAIICPRVIKSKPCK
jgi:hypothetical protein